MTVRGFASNKVQTKRKRINEGEEALYEELIVEPTTETKTIVMGMDGGSTQLRGIIVGDAITDDGSDVRIIPSSVKTVPDNREILPATGILYDKLDSNITNLTGVGRGMFTSKRLVRGRKADDVTLPEERITSNVKKTDEVIFYCNIIDAIGYSVMMKYADAVPAKVKVYLGVALPPDDMTNTKLQNNFKDKLMGQYKWSNKDMAIAIEIEIAGVELLTESDAMAQAYYYKEEKEMPEVVLSLNTGGRSTGLDLLRDGVSSSRTSKTLKYGGRKCLLDLGRAIVDSNNNNISDDIKESSLLSALQDGFVRDGAAGQIPVIDEIKNVMDSLAEAYMQDIKVNILDAGDIALREVSTVLLSGGLVRRGAYDYSFTDKLTELIKAASPNTEVLVLDDNYIPWGLAQVAYAEYGGFLEESVEDDDKFDEIFED